MPSVDQIVDIFTKVISSSKFPALRHKVKVENLFTLSLKGAIKASS